MAQSYQSELVGLDIRHQDHKRHIRDIPDVRAVAGRAGSWYKKAVSQIANEGLRLT